MDLPAIVVEGDASSTPSSVAAITSSSARAVRAFREATGYVLVELPSDAAPPVFDPTRAARITRIEEALRAARAPLDLGDASGIDALRASVAAAYGEARAHPEDPEAPFLAGEALRTLARIEDLVGDVDGARALRTRADRLDGGRAIGLSEGASSVDPAAKTRVQLVLRGDARVHVYVDGSARDAWDALDLVRGEHHVRVVARGEDGDGATLAAAWIAIGEGTTSVELRLANLVVPCSRSDLEQARGATFSVQCPRWAQVIRTAASLRVRVCAKTDCEPATTWLTSEPAKTTPPPIVHETGGGAWKSPWTWAAIGAAAVVGGTITAWQLGAFDRPEPPPPTWRWEGVR